VGVAYRATTSQRFPLVVSWRMTENQPMKEGRRRGRPRRHRLVGPPPAARALQPVGNDEIDQATAIRLTLDEVEALRLADLEAIYQEKASEAMGVSRSTYGRILESARHKLALALWDGRSIIVEGGDVRSRKLPKDNVPQCGRGIGFAGGSCICPDCGHRQSHQPGVPCRRLQCPDCGGAMMREGGERHRKFRADTEETTRK